MSDIFVSYKREEQAIARKLADLLEKEGWTVWWDPKLRAGEHFDDVIEAALKASTCVVVLWSRLSVNSRYVKDEATYALKRNKLVPVAIEDVELPFRFETLQTPRLVGWAGSTDFPEFQKLIRDIAQIVPPSTTNNQDRVGALNRQSSPVERSDTANSKRDSPNQSTAPALVREGSQPGAVFQDTLKDGSQGPEMVVVPAGTFKMGDIEHNSGHETPVHIVRIPKPFAIGKYEITFEQYDRFAVATARQRPNDKDWGRGRQPVINVSWNDAAEYAKWLIVQTGERYRLPSESEWEYAARGGTETSYWWGDELKAAMANFAKSDSRWGGKQTSPVGSFPPNSFGLYDTAGNVWEWVQDSWHEDYKGAPTDGSAWEEKGGGRRVIRGGSWFDGPDFLRSSNRLRGIAGYRYFFIGIRLAQDIK